MAAPGDEYPFLMLMEYSRRPFSDVNCRMKM